MENNDKSATGSSLGVLGHPGRREAIRFIVRANMIFDSTKRRESNNNGIKNVKKKSIMTYF